jgi:competence protein ComEA
MTMQHLRALAERRLLMVAVVCVVLGTATLVILWAGRASADPRATVDEQAQLDAFAVFDEPTAEPAGTPEAPATVIVYVSGAVQAPDVYQMPADARVKDLVLAAGGLTADADREAINLASRINDGDHIRIPHQGDAAAAAEQEPENSAAGAASPNTPLDINLASATELDELPGIGQAIAQRIVEYRAANGPFKSVDDLRNVKGVGPALFASIAPLVMAGS